MHTLQRFVVAPLTVLASMILLTQMTNALVLVGTTLSYIVLIPVTQRHTRLISATGASCIASVAALASHVCTPLHTLKCIMVLYALHEVVARLPTIHIHAICSRAAQDIAVCLTLFDAYVGVNNIAVLFSLYWVGAYIHPYFFTTTTSFIHYGLYMAYYHFRDHRHIHTFQRNVDFYAAVSLHHLVHAYLRLFTFDGMSLSMIIFGFGLSSIAIEGPITLGNLMGLLGFHKMVGFRTALPFLVPMHILFYIVHTAQVVYNERQKNKMFL